MKYLTERKKIHDSTAISLPCSMIGLVKIALPSQISRCKTKGKQHLNVVCPFFPFFFLICIWFHYTWNKKKSHFRETQEVLINLNCFNKTVFPGSKATEQLRFDSNVPRLIPKRIFRVNARIDFNGYKL